MSSHDQKELNAHLIHHSHTNRRTDTSECESLYWLARSIQWGSMCVSASVTMQWIVAIVMPDCVIPPWCLSKTRGWERLDAPTRRAGCSAFSLSRLITSLIYAWKWRGGLPPVFHWPLISIHPVQCTKVKVMPPINTHVSTCECVSQMYVRRWTTFL